MSFLMGYKIGMTQVYDGAYAVPVTVVEAGPCPVVNIVGNSKVVIGFGRKKSANKPMEGIFKKAKIKPVRFLQQISTDLSIKTGDKITTEIFQEGEKVDVTGVSKGKGTAGVIKRHGFHGGPGGHGSMFHRAPGSIGHCEFPGRVVKGTKLPGHMGVDRVTVKNLKIIKIINESNILYIKGAVPGACGSLITIKKHGKENV